MVKELPGKFKTKDSATLGIAGLGVTFVGIVIALFVVASRLDVARVELRLSRLIEYADGLHQSESLVRAPFEKGLASTTERKWDEAVVFFQQAEASAAGTQRLALENYIGMCLVEQAKYKEAESTLVPAAKLATTLGDSLGEAATLNNLAVALRAQGHYSQAESLLELAMSMHEKILATDHPNVATSRRNLARLYSDQGKYSLAEPLLKRALETHEKVLGPDNPAVATDLNRLAGLYEAQARYAEAEPLLKRALKMRERAYGPEHPGVAQVLESMAALYRKMDRTEDARRCAARAAEVRQGLEVREKAHEAQSPVPKP